MWRNSAIRCDGMKWNCYSTVSFIFVGFAVPNPTQIRPSSIIDAKIQWIGTVLKAARAVTYISHHSTYPISHPPLCRWSIDMRRSLCKEAPESSHRGIGVTSCDPPTPRYSREPASQAGAGACPGRWRVVSRETQPLADRIPWTMARFSHRKSLYLRSRHIHHSKIFQKRDQPLWMRECQKFIPAFQ